MKLKHILAIIGLIFALFSYGYNNKSYTKSVSSVSTDNLLAVSWQNAFCQTHQNKKECRRVSKSAYSATNFTLHGLWPQPRSKQNCAGKRKVFLDKELYQDLLKYMPGAKSGLQHHEWKKHGTCYGKDQNGYFLDAINLTKQVNNSKVRDLFAKNIGKIITKEQLNKAAEMSWGRGAGRKIKMACNRGMITELQINLSGKIDPKTDIATLIKSAKPARGGCKSGRVDAVGF